jgi:predicted RNA-binding protein YlxR (DUF448 family)
VTRGGRSKTRETPERRCIVTRETRPKSGLIRFVVGPDDEIVPDVAERLPGRGIWVSAEAEPLRRARGAFARAAQKKVTIPADLEARVEALLARQLVELIALARKAGQAVAGLEKTKAALVAGEAALLLQASDGSVRERAELRPPDAPDSHVSCLSGGELGMAFGRDRVIHAAVLAGGLADRIKDEALRLAGIRRGANRQPSGNGAAHGWAGEGPRGKG